MENLTILCKFPDKCEVEVPVNLISREAGSGLQGLEYLGCVALDQAKGQPAREAFLDGDKVVLV